MSGEIDVYGVFIPTLLVCHYSGAPADRGGCGEYCGGSTFIASFGTGPCSTWRCWSLCWELWSPRLRAGWRYEILARAGEPGSMSTVASRIVRLLGRFAVTAIAVGIALVTGWRLWIYYLEAPWTLVIEDIHQPNKAFGRLAMTRSDAKFVKPS